MKISGSGGRGDADDEIVNPESKGYFNMVFVRSIADP